MSIYTLGIDIGSAATKAVILLDGRIIVATDKIGAGTGSSASVKLLDEILEKASLKRGDISRLVATGYGRARYEAADKQISELTCHAKGVAFLVPGVHTIIDIGGQDAKTIELNDKGQMINFVMNEKCAAGTGRFLEVMATILETTVDKLQDFDAQSTKEVTISSTCTVFAESEVISQLSNGESREDIVRAIHKSVAKRACGLAKRVGIRERVAMTGGVAQNAGIIRAMQEELKTQIIIPENPQMAGALGAAICAWEELN